MKRYFLNNGLNSNFIILGEKDKIATSNQDIADIMNNYFSNIVNNVNLKPNQ